MCLTFPSNGGYSSEAEYVKCGEASFLPIRKVAVHSWTKGPESVLFGAQLPI